MVVILLVTFFGIIHRGTGPPTPAVAAASGSKRATPTTTTAPSTTTTTTTTPPTTTTTIAAALATPPTTAAGPVIAGVNLNTGPAAGDNKITIVGSSFEGTSAVMFGRFPATSFGVNLGGTKITARPPAEVAGTVDVTVVTPAGTSAMSSVDHYTFLGPTVTSVAPSGGPVAGGTMVTITGGDFNGASSVLFGATPVGPVFSVTNAPFHGFGTEIVAYAPPQAAGTVDITVITPGGTSVTDSADKFTYS